MDTAGGRGGRGRRAVLGGLPADDRRGLDRLLRQPAPRHLVFLLPALGGLVAGLLLTRFPQGRGFGNDAVIDSIHHHGGRIKWYMAPVTLVASALTIGSGGSAGREGPSALIGASVASTVGARVRLSRSDMRILLIAGTAACLSALFKAPLGCAVFALEVPYKNDMESSAAIPSLMASVVAYLVAVPVFGLGPYMDVPDLAFGFDAGSLLFVALVGVAAGVLGVLFILVFRLVRRLFSSLRGPFYAKVALGGLLTGLVGLIAPEVLGLGEDTVETLVSGGTMALSVLLLLLAMKLLATVFTIGSGGCGGVFFPSLFMGGLLGALMASLFGLSGGGLYVVVGMGAMMAAVTKTPIAAPILITEMVGGYALIIPVIIGSALAYIVSGDYSLYDRQLTRRSFAFDISTLSNVRVRDMMSSPVATVYQDFTLQEAAERVRGLDHYVYPVVDDHGRAVGQVAGDVIEHRAEREPEKPVKAVMRYSMQKVPADMEGVDAFELMNAAYTPQAVRMMVVDPEDDETVVGILARADVLMWLEKLDERHHQY